MDGSGPPDLHVHQGREGECRDPAQVPEITCFTDARAEGGSTFRAAADKTWAYSPAMEWDASSLELEVLTFKEGLLSKVAHDLRLVAEKLDASLVDDTVTATVDLGQLRVVCARKNGEDDHGALSAGDKTKISKSMQADVLHTKRHPEARFTGKVVRDDGQAKIAGRLSLHGAEKPFELELTQSDGRWKGEAKLHQPDFGIKPYSAMLGALKVQADVRVRVSVRATK